jgi:hypothetical protein
VLHLDHLADIAAGLAVSQVSSDVKLIRSGSRRYAKLLETGAYDAWLIEWDSAADLHLHDHGGSGAAFHLIHGELVEVYSDLVNRAPLRRVTVDAGNSRRVPVSRVHRVWNPWPAPALSIHVYSPPISSMTFYSDDKRAFLVPLWSEPVLPGAPEPVSAA